MERSQLIALLDDLAQTNPDASEARWVWLLDEIRLPEEAFFAVLEVLKEGRWKEAGKPLAYLRTAARRVFRKTNEGDLGPLELLPGARDGESFSMEDALERLGHTGSSTEASKQNDGVWKRGGGRQGESADEDGEPEDRRYRDRLVDGVPADLKSVVEPSSETIAFLDELNSCTEDHHFYAEPWVAVDWSGWADQAGFSPAEKEVLRYRLQGVSRDRAMEQQPDENSRRAIQAAWRHFDRTGQSRLRAVAQKKFRTDVPE